MQVSGLGFLGMSIDVLHLNDGNNRKELDLSLYTLPIGIDIYYRESGDDYTIKGAHIKGVPESTRVNGAKFDGLKSSVTGADVYYIFNHKRFSYPALLNQSTVQKRSAGSILAGVGFTRHSVDIDWVKLSDIGNRYLDRPLSEYLNLDLKSEDITYTDFSVSGGYGYNWVAAPRLLIGVSASLAASYKKAESKSVRGLDAVEESISNLKDFKFSDVSFDMVGRAGVVYNTGKWFAGAYIITHSYNYVRKNFSTNSRFGYLNLYFGFNFMKKKAYK